LVLLLHDCWHGVQGGGAVGLVAIDPAVVLHDRRALLGRYALVRCHGCECLPPSVGLRRIGATALLDDRLHHDRGDRQAPDPSSPPV
jgi:hypothetical protein